MNENTLVIIEEICIVLLVYGCGALIFLLWRGIAIAKEAYKRSNELRELRNIKSLSDNSFTFTDLVNYYNARSNMFQLLNDNKINVNSHQLRVRSGAAIQMATLRILVRRHPIISISSAVFLAPIGWVAVVFFCLFGAYQSHQAAQFQVMVREALKPKLDSVMNGDHVSQIVKLHELLKAGAITEHEFQTEKSKIFAKK